VIAWVEVLCAAHRKERAGDIKAGNAQKIFKQFLADCTRGRILLIPFGEDVRDRAQEIVRLALLRPKAIMVRSLDTIHLATAFAAGAKTVIAADERLREVVPLAGLRIEPQPVI